MSDFPCGHLSPSFIRTYRACPRQALYRRMLVEPERKDPYAEAGRAVHGWIAYQYAPGMELAACRSRAGWTLRQLRYEEEARRGWSHLVGRTPRLKPGVVGQTPEVRLDGEIAGVPLTGIADLLTVNAGGVWIDEWKCGSPRIDDAEQVRLYIHLVSRMRGVSPYDVEGTVHYLRQGEHGFTSERVRYTSTQDLESHLLREVIGPIREGRFERRRGDACRTCPYTEHCRTDV